MHKRVLVNGQVQSGKTSNIVNAMNEICTERFESVYVLTGSKNNLLEQNTDRYGELQFSGNYKVVDVKHAIKKKFRPKKSAKTYVFLSIKNKKYIEWINEKVSSGEIGSLLVVDDEGDEVSLTDNTGQALEDLIKNKKVSLLSITASPFKNLSSKNRSYDAYHVLEPKHGYTGIWEFKGSYVPVANKKISDLFDEILVRHALFCALKKLDASEILFNMSSYKEHHKMLADAARQSIHRLRIAANFMTCAQIHEIPEPAIAYRFFESKISPFSVIVDNGDHSRSIKAKSKIAHKVLIGGANLSRGMTYENMVAMVLTNVPQRGAISASTLLQRGRWFGYRKNAVTVYMDERAIKGFGELERLVAFTESYILSDGDYSEMVRKMKFEVINPCR